MQTNDIDWEILLFLEKSPSKKYLRKIIEFAYIIRNKLQQYDQNYQTPVSTQFYIDLNLTEEQCHKMLVSTVKLLEKAAQSNFQNVIQIFPGDFNQTLRDMLIEIFEQYGDIWKKNMNSNIQQGDKLIDVDWRIDVQVATHGQEKIKNPVIFMQLETQGSRNEMKTVNFQMNSAELNTFHNNLQKIKDQLQQIVQQ
ncbi:hypothetical protein ABPG72_016052 [Tetrahymena utriculariae]